MKSFDTNEIFDIKDQSNFEELALKIYHYQSKYNDFYSEYSNFILKGKKPTTTKQIPASDLKTYNPGGTSWQAVKTANFTAAAGQGVFCNTTSSAFTITLPAGSIGNEVSIIDYAGTADSNNITIAANGSEKIHGSTDDLTVATERAANTLVYVDSTQGWLLKNN